MDSRILGCVSIYALFKIFSYRKKYKKLLTLLSKIIQIPAINVQQLAKQLQHSNSYEGLVAGVLDSFPDQYLKSKLKENVKLLYQKLVLKKQKIRSSVIIASQKIVENVCPILKLRTGSTEVHIINHLTTNFESAVQSIIKKKYQEINQSLGKLVSIISEIAKFFESKFTYINILDIFNSECDIYEEYFIRPGQNCLVYGKFDKVGANQIYCSVPRYISKNKNALTNLLNRKIRMQKIYIAIFVIILLASSFWIFRKIYRKIIQFKDSIKNDEFRNIKVLKISSYSCSICHKNIRSIIMTPCNHLSICTNCFGDTKTSKKCQVCHNNVSKPIEIYVC